MTSFKILFLAFYQRPSGTYFLKNYLIKFFIEKFKHTFEIVA